MSQITKPEPLTYLLLIGILSIFYISFSCFADDEIPTYKEWYLHTDIEANISASKDIVAPGESITLKAETEDTDAYSLHTDKTTYSGYWTEEDKIVDPYWFSKRGSFSKKKSFSTTWTAPKKLGTYTIKFSCDDKAKIGEDDRGTRDDKECFASVEVDVIGIEIMNIDATTPKQSIVNCKVFPSTVVLDTVKFTAPGKTETKENVSGNFSFTFDQNKISVGDNKIKLSATVGDTSLLANCTATRIMKETPQASEIVFGRFDYEGMIIVPFNHFLKESYDEVKYSVFVAPGSKTLYLRNSTMESADNINPSFGQPPVYIWTEYHYYENPKEFKREYMDITYTDKNNRVGKCRSGIWVRRKSNLKGISVTGTIILGDEYQVFYHRPPIVNAGVDRSIP